ncbi:MAG: T9SS type A sorting domain-containing protein [Bacteroidia bacterium]|nr:T9SS type A sorting domain-containing protein [Bacteroidia bacterium]
MGQGMNNVWLTGYGSHGGHPDFGVSKIDFQSGIPVVNFNPIPMEFNQTQANIADANGNLLCYTNGYYIADATGDTMLNGSGINPSIFTSGKSDGLTIPQSHLIIPYPSNPNQYILFHSTIDNQVQTTASFLYYSIIDMTQNGGLGEVTLKNQILITDDLNAGKIAAVKHGNGRDWWIVCHKVNTDSIYTVLLNPQGVAMPTLQSAGIVRAKDVGQVTFSPDGSKFAYNWLLDGLEIFEFDRCSGIFNSLQFVPLNNYSGMGVAFSSNSQFVYASAGDSLFQFDLIASDILASQTLIAVYDSFVSGPIQLPTYFQLMKLAPDGKIYITTGNGTFHYHIIDQPDSLGLASNVIQHGLNLGHYYYNTLPNHPNYHLGPLVGSICDSITGLPPPEENLTLKLYPNPNNGSFQITYTPLPENLQLKVFNTLGKQVHAQLLPQWSQLQNIDIGKLSAGVYMATITSSASKKSAKTSLPKRCTTAPLQIWILP